MPFIVADRVKETTVTGSTGAVALLGAAPGFQTFAVVGNGNSTYYTIASRTSGQWEVGIGTYTASGTTLSRDTVLSNSLGTTNLVNFDTSTKDVFIDYPANPAINAIDSVPIVRLLLMGL